jgi:hypothetical protein
MLTTGYSLTMQAGISDFAILIAVRQDEGIGRRPAASTG